MPNGPEDRVLLIKDWILGYLQANPEAADTFEGINQVWLSGFNGRAARVEVEQALQELVEGRLLVMRILPDGSGLYVYVSPVRH